MCPAYSSAKHTYLFIMKRFILSNCYIFCLLLIFNPCFATWSIIVADSKTKKIGIAGASCTHSVYGIGAIVPGKGAIVVQAMSNGVARLDGFRMIMEGATAADVLTKIKGPYYNPEEQQYAILCMNDLKNAAVYTGSNTHGFGGTLTGNGVSVQGNTLTNKNVIQAVFDAAQKAQRDSLPVEDILMLALAAGAEAGGDKRCGEKKASSAFLTVSKANDRDEHWLNLVIYGKNDQSNAVDALHEKFILWKKEPGH
ncbi:MAG: DUF1028 domain-containing protein [Chitinophagaceae bacterium]|nr:MAG: DUF1028 domain-containing protein [Chitinophagaceae bacterium]